MGQMITGGVTVRLAWPEDAENAYRLAVQLDVDGQDARAVRGRFARWQQEGRLLVALDGGVCMGYAVFRKTQAELVIKRAGLSAAQHGWVGRALLRWLRKRGRRWHKRLLVAYARPDSRWAVTLRRAGFVAEYQARGRIVRYSLAI